MSAELVVSTSLVYPPELLEYLDPEDPSLKSASNFQYLHVGLETRTVTTKHRWRLGEADSIDDPSIWSEAHEAPIWFFETLLALSGGDVCKWVTG